MSKKSPRISNLAHLLARKFLGPGVKVVLDQENVIETPPTPEELWGRDDPDAYCFMKEAEFLLEERGIEGARFKAAVKDGSIKSQTLYSKGLDMDTNDPMSYAFEATIEPDLTSLERMVFVNVASLRQWYEANRPPH